MQIVELLEPEFDSGEEYMYRSEQDRLADDYAIWCHEQGFELEGDAVDLLMELHEANEKLYRQINWLTRFLHRWEAARSVDN